MTDRTPPTADRWPFLTSEMPAVPGAIKRRWEDFRVEELPLYEPSGDGDHVFFCIEKAGLTTHQAVADIARALGVSRKDIGLAGLKDVRAIARQVLSVEHVEPERVLSLQIPRIRVLWARRNRKKLRVGHLREFEASWHNRHDVEWVMEDSGFVLVDAPSRVQATFQGQGSELITVAGASLRARYVLDSVTAGVRTVRR